jgi:hypothetical protein
MRLLAPGVTYQDIQTSEAFDRACNQFLAEFLVPQIAGYGHRHASLGLDQVDDLFRVHLLRRKIVDGDVGALAGICDCRRATHAGIAAGDEGPQRPDPL